jgi:hypothetical protein
VAPYHPRWTMVALKSMITDLNDDPARIRRSYGWD